jgi:hypothetical protein
VQSPYYDRSGSTEVLGGLEEVYMSVRALLAVALVLVAVMTLTATAVLAAPGGNGNGKGGGGHGKGGGGSSTASLVVEGAPFAAWGADSYTVRGAGLRPNEPVYLMLATPGCCAATVAATDGDGKFEFTRVTAAPGTYEIVASQLAKNGKLVRMGSVSFLVTDQ